MSRAKPAVHWLVFGIFGITVLSGIQGASQGNKSETSSTRSSPIAITNDDKFVWSVNPDNNSVSVFETTETSATKLTEIPVGNEPWCVAITPDNEKAYVTNMASGTVSVVSTSALRVIDTIKVGTEPFGCALTPDGKRLFVTNQSSNTVSVINTNSDRVLREIEHVGEKPHGIAITDDGKTVFVTQFLARIPDKDPRPLTQTEGADDGREGRVTVINANNLHVIGTVVLDNLENTGFLSDGNTLARDLPIGNVNRTVTSAFPNLLESIVIKDDVAYVTGTCSSPNGPFRFNVNVQSCLSPLDTRPTSSNALLFAFPTLNMNIGVPFEPPGKRLFNTNPFAAAFKRSTAEGFVTLGATESTASYHSQRTGCALNQPAHGRRGPGKHHPNRAQGSGGNSQP